MGGRMSLNKGKRGEREVVKLLQPIVDKSYSLYPHFGEPPRMQRNTLQSDRGGYDIVGLEWMALEVKYQETLNVNQWWKQTIRQSGADQEPVLIYRQSYKPWTVVIRMHKAIGDKTFYCRSVIKVEDFLLYFEHRLFHELKSKAELLKIL